MNKFQSQSQRKVGTFFFLLTLLCFIIITHLHSLVLYLCTNTHRNAGTCRQIHSDMTCAKLEIRPFTPSIHLSFNTGIALIWFCHESTCLDVTQDVMWKQFFQLHYWSYLRKNIRKICMCASCTHDFFNSVAISVAEISAIVIRHVSW